MHFDGGFCFSKAGDWVRQGKPLASRTGATVIFMKGVFTQSVDWLGGYNFSGYVFWCPEP
jgi:hypothetical protein